MVGSKEMSKIRRVRDKLENVCTLLGVRVVSKPQKTVKDLPMKVKEKVLIKKKRDVIYKVPFQDCDM